MTPEELRETYGRQLALLVRILPVVARETRFALKGGTAINLFIRELPRLSVDIDLTYLPVAGRRDSLGGIEAALGRIGKHIETVHPYMQVEPETAKGERSLHKLTVRRPPRKNTGEGGNLHGSARVRVRARSTPNVDCGHQGVRFHLRTGRFDP